MTRLPAAVVLAALSLALTACGSSSSSSPSASASTSAAPSTSTAPASSSAAASGGGKVAISTDPAGALKFTPKAVSAKAGTVHIAFTNDASIGHNLTIVKGSTGVPIAATPTFSGATKSLTVKLGPGTYTYYCSIPGHRQAGMQGTLTVQ